jgi:glutamate-5-semialdehyde dehydrogenase
MTDLNEMGKRAKDAARDLARLDAGARNRMLTVCAEAIRKNADAILTENGKDLEAAREAGIGGAMFERLELNGKRVAAMADGIDDVARLPDPLNSFESMKTMPNGLLIGRKRVPLGVIGFIYESRPNVSADASALCIKSGNAVILRGGKEALLSNIAIIGFLRNALTQNGFNAEAVQLVTDTDRSIAHKMMKLDEYIDVLIPRGNLGLIKAVKENSVIPVIETGVGNCHIYVDQFADLAMAAEIVINAKTQRPGICNACETLLVHEAAADAFLPDICGKLKDKGVEIRGDAKAKLVVPWINGASESDWSEEYLDLIIAVKVVPDINAAMHHISRYSTRHSEAIITENYANAMLFTQEIDAAAVYVNASTRFTDGGEFGLGAEVGISTQKLHARGPVGLNELTTTKFVIFGGGQCR